MSHYGECHSDKCPNAVRQSAFSHDTECLSAFIQSPKHFSCVIIRRTDNIQVLVNAIFLLIVIWIRVILINVMLLSVFLLSVILNLMSLWFFGVIMSYLSVILIILIVIMVQCHYEPLQCHSHYSWLSGNTLYRIRYFQTNNNFEEKHSLEFALYNYIL